VEAPVGGERENSAAPRRAIFELWVPLWKAEIEHLKQQLSMRLAGPGLTSKLEFF
jgi:hypothetical protein